jgi:hypothetical protein
MKPKPFSLLKNFTVPCIDSLSFEHADIDALRGDPTVMCGAILPEPVE